MKKEKQLQTQLVKNLNIMMLFCAYVSMCMRLTAAAVVAVVTVAVINAIAFGHFFFLFFFDITRSHLTHKCKNKQNRSHSLAM